MGKKKSKQPVLPPRGRKRERSPSYSEDEGITLREVERYLKKCDTWADVLRIDALFDDGIYEGHLPWLRELWRTSKNGKDSVTEKKS